LVIAAKAGSDCTVSNVGLVHITGAGTCIVVASQPCSTNYVAAPDEEHTITINQATITTVTCGGRPFTYAGSAITPCSASVTASGALNQSLTGWGDPALIYGEDRDLFRFTDGRFALSRELADWLA
jgi:hypothetical protein